MAFAEFSKKIKALGRDVNMSTLAATKDLILPFISEPKQGEVNVVRDISYGEDERHRMDVFTPGSGFEPQRPILIFVHGGGFVGGDKHAEGSPFYSNIGWWAVQNGYNAITMTYRLAPEHQFPSGIEDLHELMRYLRHEGREHGLESESIFLMGQSAGAAHAASYVAHQEIYAPFGHGLKGLILLSGLYNYAGVVAGPMEKAYLGDDESLYESRSSIKGLLASELPMLVTLAEMDPPIFEEHGLQLLTALQEKYKKLPRFVHALGQNHLSVALYLGLEGDLVGPQILAFIEDNR